MPRAIIDTNIWVSALIGSSLTRPILKAFIDAKFVPIISNELLKELNDTLAEPQIAKLISPDKAKELIVLINEKSQKIKTPAIKINVCRDPEDNFILALLAESKAPLVTLDKDLLALRQEFNILSPKEFLKNL